MIYWEVCGTGVPLSNRVVTMVRREVSHTAPGRVIHHSPSISPTDRGRHPTQHFWIERNQRARMDEARGARKPRGGESNVAAPLRHETKGPHTQCEGYRCKVSAYLVYCEPTSYHNPFVIIPSRRCPHHHLKHPGLPNWRRGRVFRVPAVGLLQKLIRA